MNTLLPLLPPLLVFILGALTHRIIFSLLIGLISAALIATNGSITEATILICQTLWNNCETSQWTSWSAFINTNKLFVVGFILFSSILFYLMQRSHGIDALVRLTQRRIKNARSAETTSLLLSHSLFIDGYLSSITVSSIIRPIAERFRIPRLKTALLADSMSGPLVVICPISCFAALLIGLLHQNGIHTTPDKGTLLQANPNLIYWLALPFSLYSLTIIATLWMVVRTQISLSEMKFHEDEHRKTPSGPPLGNIWNFLVPTVLLPFFIVSYIMILDNESSSVWQMLTETPISFVLFAASLSTLVISTLYYLLTESFTFKQLLKHTASSARNSFPSLAIIALAWLFADILRNQLNIGQEISGMISGSIPLFLLPLVFFWVCGLVSSSLGTSWGTVAIFIPLVAPIVIHTQGLEPPVNLEQVPLFLPSIGAVVSGAALGDHVSIVSDSTILSANGALCHPVDHAKTQLPYAFPVFLGSSLGFLVAGIVGTGLFGLGVLIPLIISITSSLVVVMMMSARMKRKYSL